MPEQQNAIRWEIDPAHSLAEFSVRHMMISTVKGSFRSVKGTITGDPDNIPGMSAEAVIDASSVDTGVADRDNHLRSADFFDVENHPELTFRSKRITPKGGDAYELVGDLTIRGVTREITLDLEFAGRGKDPWGGERIGFSAETKINRKDFGLNWNTVLETGGVLVSDQVKISVEVEAVRQ